MKKTKVLYQLYLAEGLNSITQRTDMITNIVKDLTPASREVLDKRLAICKACDKMETITVPFINREVERCGLCKCPLISRTYFAVSECADKSNKKW